MPLAGPVRQLGGGMRHGEPRSSSRTVVGLALLPPRQFHPFALDTCGLGALLRAVLTEGAFSRCLVGIGGSATNDGGFGLARAVGWRFLDASGHAITQWTGLIRLSAIEPPQPTPSSIQMAVAVDVQNPLLGPTGASRVYGPQKGLRPEDFALAGKRALQPWLIASEPISASILRTTRGRGRREG